MACWTITEPSPPFQGCGEVRPYDCLRRWLRPGDAAMYDEAAERVVPAACRGVSFFVTVGFFPLACFVCFGLARVFVGVSYHGQLFP